MAIASVRRWRAALPILCFLLIGSCWVLSTPPSAGVDEGSHFARMIGMTQGGLIGGPVPDDNPVGQLTLEQLQRVNEEAGMFEIPRPLVVPVACNIFDPAQPYDCPPLTSSTEDHLDISLMGHALPGAYVLPALLSLGGSSTWRAMVLGRLGFLLQNAVLLAVACAALRRAVVDRSSGALALLALSFTPVLAFQSGTLAPNGTEVWATVAFLCALVAALRTSSRRWLWTAAVVGVVACWSRDLGAVDVIAFGVVALVLTPDGARWLWSRRRSGDVLAAVLLALGGLGSVLWQLALKVGLNAGISGPSQAWWQFGRTFAVLHESIGLLGWVNIPIDPAVDALWTAAWVAGFAVLFARARRRTREVVAALGAFYVALNMYLIAGLGDAGFGAQSRHTIAIPIAAVVVLLTGEREVETAAVTVRREAQVARRRARLLQRLRWPLVGACAIVAVGNFAGLLISAQHNATGITSAPMDFSQVAWAPPGGWGPMLVLFVVACGSVLALPFAALRGIDASAATDPSPAAQLRREAAVAR